MYLNSEIISLYGVGHIGKLTSLFRHTCYFQFKTILLLGRDTWVNQLSCASPVWGSVSGGVKALGYRWFRLREAFSCGKGQGTNGKGSTVLP